VETSIEAQVPVL